jgi:small subunit ribosomal protein S13
MVRLVGVDLPRNKRIAYALTYIHGIGLTSAKKLLNLQILIQKKELMI